MALVAGEFGDDYGAPLQWHHFDESDLAFADSPVADQIAWIPPGP